MREGKRYGLIGETLTHSFSPAIHGKLADYDYRLFELKPEELEGFLLHGDFDGLNVTIPYKKAVIPYCKALTPQARAIGSVNTIVRQADGSLLGHNTDYDGFLYQLRRTGVAVEGKKALVLGSGGASLAVRAVLRDLGAGETVTISRTGPDNYGNLERHGDARIIVNATPVGMYPNTGVSPVDLDLFPDCEGVCDLIYNPARTQLLLEAEKRNIRNSNGLGMLVAQAKAAAERFLDSAVPDRRVEDILLEMERDTRNLLLVGMPGCGKTAVGKALAQRLGRRLVDTDERIVELAGCSIPEIFASQGEDAFRRLEHRALCSAAKESGLVIATGGGIVTRPFNHDPIRQNSTVIFLRRELDQLSVEGRPLSQANRLADLYRQRLPLYQKVADITVDNITVEGAADEIIGRLSL